MKDVQFYPQLWRARIDFSVEVSRGCHLPAYLEGVMLKYPWGSYEGLLDETVHQAITPTKNYAIGDGDEKEISLLSMPTNGYERGAKYWIFNMHNLEGKGFWINFGNPQEMLNMKEKPSLETLIDLKLRRAQLLSRKTVEYLRGKAEKQKREASISIARQPLEPTE